MPNSDGFCFAKLVAEANAGLPATVAEHLAPSEEDFKAVYHAIQSNGGPAQCTKEMNRKYFRRIVSSLAMAKRLRIQHALLEAESLSIQQDCRDSQLVVTFCCADLMLRQTQGVLGQCDLAKEGLGLSAVGILHGMLLILHRAALSADGQLNQAVLDAATKKLELFAADAASDEVRACRLMSGIFPNIRHHVRDKAHGVQRVIKRCWLADPTLARIIDKLVLGKDAIAQRVRYSKVFKSRFNRYVAESAHPPVHPRRDGNLWSRLLPS